jgi:hypothetical protein
MRSCAEPWEIAKRSFLVGVKQRVPARLLIPVPKPFVTEMKRRVSMQLACWLFRNEQT